MNVEATRGQSILIGANDKLLLLLCARKGRVAELLSDQMWLWGAATRAAGHISRSCGAWRTG